MSAQNHRSALGLLVLRLASLIDITILNGHCSPTGPEFWRDYTSENSKKNYLMMRWRTGNRQLNSEGALLGYDLYDFINTIFGRTIFTEEVL